MIGSRKAFPGSLAFFRFISANANDSVTPDPCDQSSSAFLRYEFEGSLANAGTGSPVLSPVGTPAYQPTPALPTWGAPSGFTLSPQPQSPSSVSQGSPATYTVAINRQNFPGQVSTVGCTGATGVTCSGTPTTGNSITVTAQTTTNTPTGLSNLLLTASGSGVPNATSNLPLTVSASGGGGGSITLTTPSVPGLLRLSSTGISTPTSFVINSTSYTGTVTLTCPGISGVSCSPAATNVVPGSNPVTLQITAASGTASAGRYPLYINASGAGGVNANSPSVTLTTFACGLSNLNSTSLPMNSDLPSLWA